MTARQHSKLERYVRLCADRLGLRDWKLEVSRDELHSQRAVAQTRWAYGQRWAQLSFGDEFFEYSPEDQRATVIHELLHCHFGAACDAVVRNAKPRTYKHFMHQLEYGLDATAVAVADHYPLP